MWLIFKEPHFKVPLLYFWRYLVSTFYKLAKVWRGVMEQGDACKETGKRGLGRDKEQNPPFCLHGNDDGSDILAQDIRTAVLLKPQD